MNITTDIKAGKIVGNIVATFTQYTGLDELANKYSQERGISCGCDKRHEILDTLFPI